MTPPFPPDFDPDTFDWEAFAESLDPADVNPDTRISRTVNTHLRNEPDPIAAALGASSREEAYQIYLGRPTLAEGKRERAKARTVRLTPADSDLLDTVAERQKRRPAEIMREAIHHYLHSPAAHTAHA